MATRTSKSKAELRAVSGGGDHHHGIRCRGRFRAVMAWGFCDCGWEGTRRPWWVPGAQPSPGTLIDAELAAHEAAIGHAGVVGGVPSPDGYHQACAAFHGFDDDCLTPPTSPVGMLQRATVTASSDAPGALDRLEAIQQLRAWLDDQESQAVIRCRMARATWAEMGAAIGSTRQAAFNRWGATIKRYETVGVIEDLPEPEHR